MCDGPKRLVKSFVFIYKVICKEQEEAEMCHLVAGAWRAEAQARLVAPHVC